MSRFPAGLFPPKRSVPSGCRSSPQRVEEKILVAVRFTRSERFPAPLRCDRCSCEPRSTQDDPVSIRPPKSECRSLRAIPPPDDLGTTQAGRYRIDHSHAGFPQGLLTRRFSSYLVSYWLTNAIDRIVKETPHVELRVAPEIPALPHTTCGGDVSLLSTDAIGRCKAAISSSPRPSSNDDC